MLKLPTIPAAGGLVVNKKKQILFIYKNGRWDLPKGLIESDCPAHETACSEVAEETGLPKSQLLVATELIPTTHISKFQNRKQLKVIRWFLILYLGDIDDAKFAPQQEEGVELCRWFSKKEVDEPLSSCPSRIRYLVRFWLKARKEVDLFIPKG